MVLSLGAALYEGRSAGHKSDLLGPSGVAAPEDGRTPDASNRAIPRGPVIRGQIMKKERNHSASEKTAFTRLELVMVLATTGLLAGLALPLLGSTKSRSDQVSCLSNLRQIGHAFHLWANDHGDKNPWWTAIRDGGSYVSPGETLPPGWLRNNPYFQMAFVSNELHTPKILVCPADPKKIIATTFIDFYFRPTYENNAVSYFIGLHSFFASPHSILSGDRNFRFDSLNAGCSAGVGLVQTLNFPNTSTEWSNAIHGLTGNLLFTDGAVEQVSSTGLRKAVNLRDQNENGSLHFIVP